MIGKIFLSNVHGELEIVCPRHVKRYIWEARGQYRGILDVRQSKNENHCAIQTTTTTKTSVREVQYIVSRAHTLNLSYACVTHNCQLVFVCLSACMPE